MDQSKLAELAEIEGFGSDILGLLEANVGESVCPAICTNLGCSYTDELEPDQDEGYCEECREGSMKSAMVLAGII